MTREWRRRIKNWPATVLPESVENATAAPLVEADDTAADRPEVADDVAVPWSQKKEEKEKGFVHPT